MSSCLGRLVASHGVVVKVEEQQQQEQQEDFLFFNVMGKEDRVIG